MKCFTVTLHVELYSIHDYQWLCISVERVQTANEHHVTHCRISGTGNRTNVGTEIVLNLIVYGDIVSMCFKAILCSIRISVLIHWRKGIAIQLNTYHLCRVITLNCDLLCRITWSLKVERRSKVWNLHFKLTLSISHSCVAFILKSLNTYTSNRFL